MSSQLRLTGFLESFDGEPCLLLQVQWKDLRLPFPPALMASSLLYIPFHSQSRLPPSPLDLRRSFSAAQFSPGVVHYLDQKISSFVLDLASAFAGVSPPSLFVLAEIETQPQIAFYRRIPEYWTPPLMPRRMDPAHQPLGVSLRSRLFTNDDWVGDFTGVHETEADDPPDQNLAGASLQAITKLGVLKLEKEESEIGECSVCLQGMSAIKGVLATSCDHVFHATCIRRWLETKNTCPLCRAKLHD